MDACSVHARPLVGTALQMKVRRWLTARREDEDDDDGEEEMSNALTGGEKPFRNQRQTQTIYRRVCVCVCGCVCVRPAAPVRWRTNEDKEEDDNSRETSSDQKWNKHLFDVYHKTSLWGRNKRHKKKKANQNEPLVNLCNLNTVNNLS